MLLIKFSISSWGIFSHSSRSLFFRSPRFSGMRFLTCQPKVSHKCSIGLRSGLRAGQSKALITSYTIHVLLDDFSHMETCIVPHDFPEPRLCTVKLQVPLSQTSSVPPSRLIPPQTITEPPLNAVLEEKLPGEYLSPDLLHILSFPPGDLRRNLDSSEKRTDFH